MLQEKEQELRKKEQQIDSEYKKFLKKKEDNFKTWQEEMFLLDLERERQKKDKSSNSNISKQVIFDRNVIYSQKELDEIQKRLDEFKQKVDARVDNKMAELRNIQERMHSFNQRVDSSKILKRNDLGEDQDFLQQTKKTFSRLIQCDKHKKEQEELRLYEITERNRKKFEN